MKAIKKAVITGAAVLGMVALNSPAQATSMFLEDWTLNLTNVPLQGLSGAVGGIDQILYKGITHVSVTDKDSNASISVGDTFKVDGLLRATDYLGAGFSLDGLGLNNAFGPVTTQGYELTMKFTVNGEFTPGSGSALTFSHPAGGTLDLFVDNLKAAPGTRSNTLSAVGFTDGTKIASFNLVSNAPGTGGPFFPGTLNGSDDAFFATMTQISSVFQKPLGVDLGTSLAGVWTRSNFSAIATTPSTVGWEAEFGVGSAKIDALNFFVDENGDARVVTPEPGTMALVGVGLLGLAIAGKRRKNNK